MLIPVQDPAGKYKVPLDAGQDTGRADIVAHEDSVDKVGEREDPDEYGGAKEEKRVIEGIFGYTVWSSTVEPVESNVVGTEAGGGDDDKGKSVGLIESKNDEEPSAGVKKDEDALVGLGMGEDEPVGMELGAEKLSTGLYIGDEASPELEANGEENVYGTE